jgi:hypothetical protein
MATTIPSPVYGAVMSLKVVVLPPYVQDAILEASKQAKILFDINQWEWAGTVPTLGQIVDLYAKLTQDAVMWPEIGNARSGHLVVEYTDGILEFNVEVAFVET